MVLDVFLSFLRDKTLHFSFREDATKITEVGFIKNLLERKTVLILLLINYEVYFFVSYVF